MTTNHRWHWIPALLLGAACAGCPTMAITTAATTAASATADDRSYEQQLSDDARKADIEKQFVENQASLAAEIDVDVYLGHVMLTGAVADESTRRAAVALARDAAPDAVIYDDIQVVPPGSGSDGGGFLANEDLGLRLIQADGLGSQSFQHRVVNGVAYIMGEAKTEEQVEIARRTALGTSGVQSVVTHIFVRP